MRKKILILSDQCTFPSGVGKMSKNIIKYLCKYYDIVHVGAAKQNPDNGKIIDLSEYFNKEAKISDASVKMYAINGFGNAELIQYIIETDKPDALFHFTDPTYWTWLYEIAPSIRKNIPIIYYHVWDNYPAPKFNLPYYKSCDSIICISKLTYEAVNEVLGQQSTINVSYVPHGIDTDYFYKIEDLNEFTNETVLKYIGDVAKYNRIYFFNSRNIPRKNIPSLIQAYCEEYTLGSLLLLKTEPRDPNGTNLIELVNRLKNNFSGEIKFVPNNLTDNELNVLYNVATCTINVSSQEGWGLSTTESMICGTPIVVNDTGGLTDQCRITNFKDNWIGCNIGGSVNNKYINNGNTDIMKEKGGWAVTVKSNRTIIGSQIVPYIYDDRVDVDDLKLFFVSMLNDISQLEEVGEQGRQFALEHFTLENMGDGIKTEIEKLFEKWEPNTEIKIKKIGN